jgi:hypothetical protein
MLASRSIPFVSALAACVIIAAAMFVMSGYSSQPSELVEKTAVVSKKTKSA